MENSKTVSIIVPVFNVEAYLERCVNSLTQQTYENLEILLVDDCSADNSPALCDELSGQDSRIKVIHKPVNEGLGFARNTGIENASGDIIMFVDSDDYLDKNTCLIAKNALEENEADICCFVFADVYSDRTQYNNFFDKPLIFESEKVVCDFLPKTIAPKETDAVNELGLDVSACTVMYRADIIRENDIRFVSEREYINEDMLFRIEICKHIKKAVVLPDNLYFYYHNEGTLTTAYKKNRFASSLKMYDKAKALCSGLDCEELERRNERYFMSNVLVCIKQEVAANKKGALKEIKAICKNEELNNVLNNYPVFAMPKAQKAFYTLIRKNCPHLVFALTKIKLISDKKTLN